MFRLLKCRTMAWCGGLALSLAASLALLTAASAQSKEPIKIGFAMALTGFLSPNGKQALLAMKIWEERTNKAGGLLGRPVKLVYYDDKSSPAEIPGIYTKLLDVDKVDLLLGPYATNQNAPAMPIVIRKKKLFISLFALGLNTKFKYKRYFSMLPTGPTPKEAFTEGYFDVAAQQKPKPKTVAIATADAEFSQNCRDGAKANAKKHGFKLVYDKTYPPPPQTTDFAPIVRALKAANADLVVICAYPLDSVGIALSAAEAGLSPKMFGGGMVGLQATVFKNKLKTKLNGITNYEFWVPVDSMMYSGTKEFFAEYQARAKKEGIDPLGYYLGGWGYAYIQLLGQAVQGAKSLNDDKLAAYIRTHTFKTVMGDVKFGKNGEWAKARVLQVQYHGIKDSDGLDTWRGMSYQTIVSPKEYATGKVIYPFAKAR
jgi:branched-chain amino acid transport system substrate-binding protein